MAEQNDRRFGFLKATLWGTEPYQQSILPYRNEEIAFTFRKTLYHYTDLHGLMGIVRTRGVWASHIRYMNDSSEFQHGIGLCLKLIERASAKAKYSELRACLEASADELQKHTASDLFIACFSGRQDSLDHWRAYCPDGGVCIEFDLRERNPFFVMPVLALSDVIYDDRVKARLVLRLLSRYLYEYKADKVHYGESFKSYISWGEKEYANNIAAALNFMCLRFKHTAFKNEDEVRMIVRGGHKDQFYEKMYRANSRFIMPYFNSADLKHYDAKGGVVAPDSLPIHSVTIGPSPYQELTASSVRDFLRDHGLPDVSVHLSSVPHRSV